MKRRENKGSITTRGWATIKRWIPWIPLRPNQHLLQSCFQGTLRPPNSHADKFSIDPHTAARQSAASHGNAHPLGWIIAVAIFLSLLSAVTNMLPTAAIAAAFGMLMLPVTLIMIAM